MEDVTGPQPEDEGWKSEWGQRKGRKRKDGKEKTKCKAKKEREKGRSMEIEDVTGPLVNWK